MRHHAFSWGMHFREMGAQSRNTLFNLLLGDMCPVLCSARPPALPSSPVPRSAAQEAGLSCTAPSGLPCPSASGWVQPMEDTRDERTRAECRALPLLSLPARPHPGSGASSVKSTFRALGRPRLLVTALSPCALR